MESKAFLFISIPLVAIILIFSYLNIQQEKSPNPSITENSEQCQSIHFSGTDRIDLLFISSKEDAERYAKVLFDAEPYKKHKEYFNVRVLEEEAKCDYYREMAILCNTKQVIALSKQCPNDYILVVKKDSAKIRSSAYGNIISINSAHEDSVLIHEIGHALGNLAEEYGGAKIPLGSKNCVASCDKFKGTIDSCELECSTSSHYRSIKSGVMRTLATSNYGVYNIALLTELIEKNKPRETTITGNQILEEESCENKILQLQLFQSENKAEIKTDNILETGCAPDKGLEGGLCIGEVCNINTLFTDYQDTNTQDTLDGETYLTPEVPLTFYINQNPSNPLVEIFLNNEQIAKINTNKAGATACKR